ncbi:MAG: hypothetical protein PVI86_04100 [Phycisphaerae bacterium]|jgi:hypothetical protein
MTGEHLVSKCVLPAKTVKVRGLPWCQGELREVGVANLTANILCGQHNNALTEADEEVKRFQDAMARFRNSGPNQQRQGALEHLHLDGRKFTRWLCKTYCNFLVSNGQQPDLDLIRHAFLRGTSRRLGVYAVSVPPVQMQSAPDQVLSFGDMRSDTSDFLAHFVLFGFPWVLMTFELAGDECIPLPRGTVPIGRRDLLHEPARIAFEAGGSKHELVIIWPRRRGRRT